MAKKEKQPVKCEQCDLEFPESELSEKHKGKAFVWQGKVMCEDCLFKMGASPAEAMTYSAFVDSQQPRRPQSY
ncbi:MAG: hypothetical protein Q8O43_05890 [Dehalococcoidia bacterium]|nr:hypothetical protein [Dehalococcoidia bacterium]